MAGPNDATTRRERREATGVDCPRDDVLAAFVEGGLTPAERAAIEAHVDGCPACRAVVGHVTATATAAPTQPRMIHRYRLDRELGRGGMGVVWKAWDPALERVVAVKLLHPELDDDRWRARALREARALARLQHPNVIAVHDVGEADGEVFIATEFIDGESLDQWQRGRPAAEIVGAYAQAARGLAAAHAIGLIHRDIKPSNILVARDGRVCVGDFGLATTALRKGESLNRPPRPDGAPAPTTTLDPARRPLQKLTRAGELLGTPAYMAPEQLAGGEADARSDQYALCLALAESLIGRDLPEPPTAEALAAVAPGVTGPWAAIARGLSIAPGDRFPDMKPLIAALDPAPAAAATATATATPAPGRWPARRTALAVAGVAAIALGFAAWRWTRSSADGATADPPRDPITATSDGSGRGAGSAGTPPGGTRPPADDRWSWVASATGPYHLPVVGAAVRLADDHRAVVLAAPLEPTVTVVDLDTGATEGPVAFTAAAPATDASPDAGVRFPAVGITVDNLARAGGRLVAFGADGATPAAWQIELDPLRITALALPAVAGRVPDNLRPWDRAVVSPDGGRIALCNKLHLPVVRDARTLAIVRRLPTGECDDLRFTAPDRVLIDTHEVDLTTGKARTINPKTAPVAGPAGHRLVPIPNGFATRSRVVTADGTEIQAPFDHDPTRQSLDLPARWTPDGIAITWSSSELALRPAPDGTRRAIQSTISSLGLDSDFDVDDRRAVLLHDAVIEVVDLATGAKRTAAGNLASVTAVAPGRGGVVAAADMVRAWRGAAIERAETQGAWSLLDVSPALGVLARTNDSTISLWDPATGLSRRIGENSAITNDWLAVRGERLWFVHAPP